NDDRPMRFQAMQRRLGRKATAAGLQGSVPVVFMAYDLLEEVGEDLRPLPLEQRRARLEKFVSSIGASKWIKLSPRVAFADWSELAAIRAQARERAAEGLMLKRRDSPYRVGRVRGDWWKWKVDPYQIDAVLINAQPGHGKRASLFTDYTFGVWDQGELVPVAKAYSGLTDAEIREVDRFVRQHTRDRFGPVRVVEPQLVFELHFAGLQASGRHKSGVAVRFPRIGRWRRDKKPDEADTLETVKALLAREQSDAA
ncbi:MAG: ATP-dependent DNA ligase, partial [Verrucomicrobiae bacterium]|nr:ATP-dependent DNA ligase [Verrucomicrobiae bacterium]